MNFHHSKLHIHSWWDAPKHFQVALLQQGTSVFYEWRGTKNQLFFLKKSPSRNTNSLGNARSSSLLPSSEESPPVSISSTWFSISRLLSQHRGPECPPSAKRQPKSTSVNHYQKADGGFIKQQNPPKTTKKVKIFCLEGIGKGKYRWEGSIAHQVKLLPLSSCWTTAWADVKGALRFRMLLHPLQAALHRLGQEEQ